MKNTKALAAKAAEERVLSFFEEEFQKGRVAESVINKLQRGQLQKEDHTMILRKKISGAAGIVELITDALDKVRGITSISGGKLPENNYFIIEGVRVGYAVATTASTPKEATVKYLTHEDASLPSVLRNSELWITEDDATIQTFQICDLLSADKSQEENAAVGKVLTHLRKLSSDARFNLKLAVAEGESVTVASNEVFIEVALMGTLLRNRPNG